MAIPETGFIKNVNTLADKISIIEVSNEIFNENVIDVLQDIALLDLDEAIQDLKKGNYLGNRKLDINLALNMIGVTEDILFENPDAVEAIWVNPAKTVQYSGATVTFNDGVIIELPFIFDGNPTTVSTHADLLTQLSRYDFTNAIRQVATVSNIVPLSNTQYSITINSSVISFTSDGNATVAEIITGLVNTINLSPVPVTAAEAGLTFTLSADVPGTPFTATVVSNMVVTATVGNEESVITETQFLAKLDNSILASFASNVVGEIIRVYDIVGFSSNLERIQLHASSGQFTDPNPLYYWAKTTSAFQTLSMRAGDVIKLGNDIDSIIALASRITEMIDLQNKIPQLVTNGDSLYTNIAKLVIIYEQLSKIITVHNDVKVGGTNYTNTVALDLVAVNSKIATVAADLQLGGTSAITIVKNAINSVIAVATSIGNVNIVAPHVANVDTVATSIGNVNLVGPSITSVNTVASKIANVNTVATNINNVNITGLNIAGVNTVATDIANVNTTVTNIASVNSVASKITNVNTVATNIASVNTTATNITSVNTVTNNIASINTNAANIVAIQNASTNANTAIAQADIAIAQAGIASTKAGIATTQAGISTAQAVIATGKANSILGLTTQASTGAAGSLATVSYNSTDGKMTFSIPQGIQGIRGEAFTVNSVGLAADKPLYNSQIKGFSFLAIDLGLVYFKLSNTTADWSTGAPFGKGDKGDVGLTGNGITSIAFLSSTDVSNLAGVPGATDTYRITMSDASSYNFSIYNGLNGVLIDDVTLSLLDTWSNQKISNELALKANLNSPNFTGAVSGISKAMVGLSNADNTSDTSKPISIAQQTALNLKANSASPTFTGTVNGITASMVGAPTGTGNSSGTNTGDQDLSGKQNVLISGVNVKTLNGSSILGSGNLTTPDPVALSIIFGA